MVHVRPYIHADWPAILEICLLAFTPIHESFEGMLGTELFKLVYPDWKSSNEKYLCSLIDSEERDRTFVADENGIVLGFIHFEFNMEKQCGEIGLNAVHPDRQSRGIGSLMYRHVLDLLQNQGITYVKVSTGGDQSHMPARHAYEKAGFVPLPVANYFRKLGAPASIGTMRSAPSQFQAHPRLIIVSGLPGSGKTSHAKEIEQNLRAVRLCADEWMDAMGVNLWEGETRQRVEQLQWRTAQQILAIGGIVVIEWGTWARSERDVLRKGARCLGAAVELHFLDAPIDILFERIRRRNVERPALTFEDIQKWDAIFERPSSEEMALFDPALKRRFDR